MKLKDIQQQAYIDFEYKFATGDKFTMKIKLPTVNDIENSLKSKNKNDDDIIDGIQRNVDFFSTAILGWNLTEADGSVMPITKENIRKLPQDILIRAMEEVNSTKKN